MKFAPIIDPSVRKPSPKPVRVDLRKVFTFGTALWAIALVICMILLAFGINVERLQTMCACWFGSISTGGTTAVLANNPTGGSANREITGNNIGPLPHQPAEAALAVYGVSQRSVIAANFWRPAAPT